MSDAAFPWFQPVVDINGLTVVGHETLARRRNQSGEVVPMASGFWNTHRDPALVLLDRRLRYRAMQEFVAAGQPGYLSLNIAPQWMLDISDDDPVPTIDMAAELGVDPQKIVIEFIESAGESAGMQKMMRRYRDAGMRIAIDDYGSGHSHLDRLLALEPDVIKLDMALFNRAVSGGLSADVVLGIADFARRSGSLLCCEGVETTDALHFALDCGARLVQGFLFSDAAPGFHTANHFETPLKKHIAEYLDSKVRYVQVQRDAARQLLAYFHALAGRIDETGESIAAMASPPPGFLRAYLCDSDGIQVSPNYELDADGGWFCDPANRGNSWATRPYFYQLMAGGDDVSFSAPYRDFGGGELCVTMGQRIGENRLLFVDQHCAGLHYQGRHS